MPGPVSAILFLTPILLAAPARAQSVPSFSAGFLEIEPSTRSLGMGSAAAGVVEDADGIWSNPAALAFTNSPAAASYSHRELIPELNPDVDHDAMAFSARLDGIRGGIAGGVTYLDFGDWSATDLSGNVIEFHSYDLAPAIAFGSRLTNKIGVGLGFKVVREYVAPASLSVFRRDIEGTTAAVDIGCQLRPNSTTRVGICFQNLGPDQTFDDPDRSFPLPRNLKIGVAQQVFAGGGQHFLVAADLNKYLIRAEYEPILNLGAEHGVSWRGLGAAIRYGWIYTGWLYDEEPINGGTHGFGLTFKGVSFGYASVPLAPGLHDRQDIFSFGTSF